MPHPSYHSIVGPSNERLSLDQNSTCPKQVWSFGQPTVPSVLPGPWLEVADVCFRDVRNPMKPQLQYVESHNDDITEVCQDPQLLDDHR